MQSTAHFRSAPLLSAPLFFAAWFVAALCMASVFPFVAAAQNANNPQVVRLAKVEGAVEVQRPTEPAPEAAPANLPLEQGATLTTERGTASIEWDNGGTGFVADNSVLEFTELATAPNGRTTRLTMREGAARFFANVGNADTFAVLTPDVTVTAQPGGDFRVDVYRDGTTVTVLNGRALVGSAGASWAVEKGQTLSMPSGALQPTIAASPPLDTFDHRADADYLKNMQDIAAERGYLAPALTGGNTTYGMAELHNYGTWTPVPDYGYGWQPLGVGADWLPFQNGIWILSPATGQTGPFWVSGEPWGWLPYHFGRWLYSPQGWFWIPSTLNTFNPAPVDFVHVGNRAGWVAASPLDQPNKTPANAARGVLVKPAVNGKTQIASATTTPGGTPGAAVKITATGGLQTMGNLSHQHGEATGDAARTGEAHHGAGGRRGIANRWASRQANWRAGRRCGKQKHRNHWRQFADERVREWRCAAAVARRGHVGVGNEAGYAGKSQVDAGSSRAVQSGAGTIAFRNRAKHESGAAAGYSGAKDSGIGDPSPVRAAETGVAQRATAGRAESRERPIRDCALQSPAASTSRRYSRCNISRSSSRRSRDRHSRRRALHHRLAFNRDNRGSNRAPRRAAPRRSGNSSAARSRANNGKQ